MKKIKFLLFSFLCLAFIFSNAQTSSGYVKLTGVDTVIAASPLTGGTIIKSGTIGIQNAAADGGTKGAASFTGSDFNASSGNISLDYTNGQTASGSTKGYLSSSDWTKFNNKVDSVYLLRIYDDLYNEWVAHSLQPGIKYLMSDHSQIYDIAGPDTTETADVEPIVLTASSDSTFSPLVYSLYWPDDVILYDISVDTTYINSAPAKGKIKYRKDLAGNEAYFDFRNVLFHNPNDNTEGLIFEGLATANSIATTPEFTTLFGMEFARSRFSGTTRMNTNNTLVGVFSESDFTQQTSNSYFNVRFEDEASQCANNTFSNTTFSGTVFQMMNIDGDSCSFSDQSNYCTTGTYFGSYFGEQVNKCIGTNFSRDSIIGRIDRLFNAGILNGYFGGRLYWCNGLFSSGSRVAGDFSSGNLISFDNTIVNCKVSNLRGMGHHSQTSGFLNCTITGTNSSSTFGYVDIQCIVSGKTITEALYPELFDVSFPKIIYTKPNGEVWYRWLDDSNVWQFEEIL